MSSLSNKRIILGVTGGIAAYKSAEIIRRLQDQQNVQDQTVMDQNVRDSIGLALI